MAEVKALFGGRITEAGANQDVIDGLERLVEQARRGEIISISLAWLDGAEVANSQVIGSCGHTAAMGGAITMLQHRFFTDWRKHNDE